MKYKKAKKKAQKYAVSKGISFRNKGHGKLSYVKKSGKKAVTVNKKTGKITVKKKTKKGTYRIKVKVTAAGGANHNAGSKIVTVIVKVLVVAPARITIVLVPTVSKRIATD